MSASAPKLPIIRRNVARLVRGETVVEPNFPRAVATFAALRLHVARIHGIACTGSSSSSSMTSLDDYREALRELRRLSHRLWVPRFLSEAEQSPLYETKSAFTGKTVRAQLDWDEFSAFAEESFPAEAQADPALLPLPTLVSLVDALHMRTLGIAIDPNTLPFIHPSARCVVSSPSEPTSLLTKELSLWLRDNASQLLQVSDTVRGMTPSQQSTATDRHRTLMLGCSSSAQHALVATLLRHAAFRNVMCFDTNDDAMRNMEESLNRLISERAILRRNLNVQFVESRTPARQSETEHQLRTLPSDLVIVAPPSEGPIPGFSGSPDSPLYSDATSETMFGNSAGSSWRELSDSILNRDDFFSPTSFVAVISSTTSTSRPDQLREAEMRSPQSRKISSTQGIATEEHEDERAEAESRYIVNEWRDRLPFLRQSAHAHSKRQVSLVHHVAVQGLSQKGLEEGVLPPFVESQLAHEQARSTARRQMLGLDCDSVQCALQDTWFPRLREDWEHRNRGKLRAQATTPMPMLDPFNMLPAKAHSMTTMNEGDLSLSEGLLNSALAALSTTSYRLSIFRVDRQMRSETVVNQMKSEAKQQNGKTALEPKFLLGSTSTIEGRGPTARQGANLLLGDGKSTASKIDKVSTAHRDDGVMWRDSLDYELHLPKSHRSRDDHWTDTLGSCASYLDDDVIARRKKLVEQVSGMTLEEKRKFLLANHQNPNNTGDLQEKLAREANMTTAMKESTDPEEFAGSGFERRIRDQMVVNSAFDQSSRASRRGKVQKQVMRNSRDHTRVLETIMKNYDEAAEIIKKEKHIFSKHMKRGKMMQFRGRVIE